MSTKLSVEDTRLLCVGVELAMVGSLNVEARKLACQLCANPESDAKKSLECILKCRGKGLDCRI